MKLTKEQINQIKELAKEGKTPKEISIKLILPYSTVLYYYGDKHRLRQISYQKTYQKKFPPKRGDRYREYQREYQKARYWKLKQTLNISKREDEK